MMSDQEEKPEEGHTLRMNVLVIAKDEKISKVQKAKVFDMRFARTESAFPGIKTFRKDAHGIAIYSTKESDLQEIMDTFGEEFKGYPIKTIYGTKNETTREYEEKGWKFFPETANNDDLKDHLRKAFDEEVIKIKGVFESIDNDKNGFLTAYELATVSEKLDKPMSKEEIDLCVKIIDSNGDNEITFDEFALWWIAGREGAPQGLGDQFAKYLESLTKLTNFGARIVTQQIKQNKGETMDKAKDLRNFHVKFLVGQYKDKEPGITLSTTFGIADAKTKPALIYQQQTNFSANECWFFIKLHVDTSFGESIEDLVEVLKNSKLKKMFDRYTKIHNRLCDEETKDQTNKSTLGHAKFEINGTKNNEILIGLQGGHQLTHLKESTVQVVEGLFTKIIDLQKQYGQNDLCQKINFELSFCSRFIDLLSSKRTILESLMKGMSLDLNVSLLNKIDEIIVSLFKMLEEQAKKTEIVEEKKAGGEKEKEKEEEEAKQAQKHMLHMASMMLKTKMNAEFKMNYVEGTFQNDLLNLIPKGVREYLLMSPSRMSAFFKKAGEAFESLTEDKNEEAEQNSKVLSEMFNGLPDGANQLVESLKGVLMFIMANKGDESDPEMDNMDPLELINEIIKEVLEFLLVYLNERFEIFLHLKTCFLNVDINIKDLRKTLVSLAQAFNIFDEKEPDMAEHVDQSGSPKETDNIYGSEDDSY